jgi:hypothetical protein
MLVEMCPIVPFVAALVMISHLFTSKWAVEGPQISDALVTWIDDHRVPHIVIPYVVPIIT